VARERFQHEHIEKKSREKWERLGVYKTEENSKKEKKFVLDMFPYPSGEGLHVGHPKGYIATDIYSRLKRMQGYAVMHPMGWDAFGLPAENYALKNKVHPRVAVEKNIARFKEQLEHIGFDYDWDREINTTDPAYYKWTQWIFLQLYKKGLAYQSEEPINWCPSCMTGLANEDLDGTVCERCGTTVEKRALPQWVLKITDYADRMLTDLDTLQWPSHIKEAQRNWIGRSEGAHITFSVVGTDETIRIFTTRPDTLYGATYMVLAPEHPLIATLASRIKNMDAVQAYVSQTKAKTEIERADVTKEKTGVKLEGILAINPATKEEIPVFIADYVIGSYGTGAIMAVPAHDERDFAFAQKFGLPIRHVIEPKLVANENGDAALRPELELVRREAVCAVVRNPKDDTYLCNSWKTVKMNGLFTGGIDEGEDAVEAARREVMEETGYKNLKHVVHPPLSINTFFYHRIKNQNRHAHFQFVFFDLIDDERNEVTEEEAALHEVVWKKREELKSFFTVFEGDFIADHLDGVEFCYEGNGILKDSGEFTGMETNDAKSSITEFVGGIPAVTYKLKDWVFSRQRYWGEPIPIIHCPKDGAVAVPENQLPVLLPEVESYEPSGTGESPLASITEWVNTTCPTCHGPAKRETNTMPQWAGSSWYYLRYMDPRNDEALVSKEREKYWAPVDVYVGGDHAVRHLIYARFWHKFLYDIGTVSTIEPFARLEFLGFILAEDGTKMSKRQGNVINPDDVVAEHGADAFRIYEMFMGPFEGTTAWSTGSIAGTARFVERVWKAQDMVGAEPNTALNALLHKTIQKVGEDIEAFKFNTAVSQMMIFMNALEKAGSIGKEQWSMYLRTLAPFAPHLTEELWEELGENGSIHATSFPVADTAFLVTDTATVVVQVDGKRRGELNTTANATEEEVSEGARALPAVVSALEGKSVLRTIYVPGRLINLVSR